MARSRKTAAAPQRQSSRPSKKPKFFGVIANPDLGHLLPGVSYGSDHTKATAGDEKQGCSQDLHDVGYVATDDREQRGEELYQTVLRHDGWYHVKRGLLDTNYSFIVHPFTLNTATEGVTMFRSYVTIGEQLQKDGGDHSQILERAKQAIANLSSANSTQQGGTDDNDDESAQQDKSEPQDDNSGAGDNNVESAPPVLEDWQIKQEEEDYEQNVEVVEDPVILTEVEQWLVQKLGSKVPAKIRNNYANRMVEFGLDSVEILDYFIKNTGAKEASQVLGKRVRMKPYHITLLTEGTNNS